MLLSANMRLDFIVDILLVTAIFEKIRYSVFDLFTVIAIAFVFAVGIMALRNKIILRDSSIKVLYFSKIAIFFLYIMQIMLVVFDGRDAIFDQYYKGLLVHGVSNVFLVLATIYYLSIYSKIDTDTLLKKFAKVGFVNIVYNVIQYFNRDIDDIIFIKTLHSSVSRYGTDAYGSGVGRLTGLFTDSNNNAAFLILYFMIVFILMKGTKGKKSFLLYLLLMVTALELVLTYSRTGWLGIAFCIVCIFFKEGLLKNTKLLVVIVAGIMLGIYAYNNIFVFHEIMTARLAGLGAENSHLVAARDTLGIIAQSPIFYILGVGINCLSVHYEVLYGRVGMKAHSLYLQALCETGVIGLFLTLLFWGTLFYMSYKASKSENKLYGIPISVIGFLIINLTYDSAFQSLSFWVLTLVVITYRDKYLDFLSKKSSTNELEYRR